jgi:hypothetical protein
MKKLLLFIALLISLFSYSQNGGQSSENNVLKIEYIGYSSGNHIFKITNKVNCELVTKLDQNGTFVDHTLSALQSSFINIPASSSSQIVYFKAKREGGAICKQNPDNGWTELQSAIVLSIKFGQITATKINPGLIKLTFESEEDNTIKHYNILVSEDGKVYRKAHILFPDGITGGKKYSVLIKL